MVLSEMKFFKFIVPPLSSQSFCNNNYVLFSVKSTLLNDKSPISKILQRARETSWGWGRERVM